MDEATREFLADPAVSLQLYAHVVDQDTGAIVRYDPFALTRNLQQTIISYMSNPPRDANGYAKWMVALKARQTGASTTTALSIYPKVCFKPGVEAVIIADTRDRADGLFDRIQLCHQNWPEDIRAQRQSSNEARTFTTKESSRVRVLSGHSDAVGVGRSVDILHCSELPLWADARKQLSMLLPAMFNRKNSLVVQESTAFPLSEPSAEFWQEQCRDAMFGAGRYIFTFSPFWDGLLNRRPWPKGQIPDSFERKFMELHGAQGLTLDNLQFRREIMDSDSEIRRNHALFGVFFPFDPYTCWISSGSGVIPSSILDRFTDLKDEHEGLTIFEESKPGSQYLIGVDPSGWGRDHAAFQVMEIWADEWVQVASYGAQTDPNEFAKILFDIGVKYNMAMIAVERNGVGAAPIALLKAMKYPRIYHDTMFRAGLHKSNQEEWLSLLVDALMDKLKMVGKETISQTRGYRSDKAVERSVRSELLATNAGRRRARHHYDRVSALMVAVAVAPYMPVRYRPQPQPDNVVLFRDLSWDEVEAYRGKVNALEAQRKGRTSGRRTHYRRRKV